MNEAITMELAPTDAGKIIPRDEPQQNPLALIQQAIAKGVDVGVLERLEAMHERYQQREAKRQFDTALAAFQSECPVILKSVNGAQNNYKFAPLDHIVTQVKPLLEKHGFSYALTADVEEGWVKASIRVTHRAGHSEASDFKVPIDKRNGLMSEPQRYGGSMTYAKRISFCNAFGILTADEDRDGQSPGLKRGLKSRLAEQQGTDARKESPAGQKPAGQPAVAQPKEPDGAITKALKATLWNLLVTNHVVPIGEKTWDSREAWLREKKMLPAHLGIKDATVLDLQTMIEKVEIELGL